MSWNMDRIGDMVAERSQSYNKETVMKAAQAVAAVANAGIASLYGPGTDKAVGETRTRVKAEFFRQPDRVKELMANFASEANQLVKVAEAGEPAAIRQQLGRTNEACKACHDSFRIN
jgi:cytochrome c556